MKVRQIEEGDLDKLPAFLAEGLYPDPEVWKRRFKMWWIDNPCMNPEIPRGWILENKDAEIVGCLCNIPVKFQINGRICRATAASAWYVKPTARSGSFLLYRAFMRQEKGNLLLNTTATDTVQQILPTFGFSTINIPFNNTVYWYICGYPGAYKIFIDKLSQFHKVFSCARILQPHISLVRRLNDNNVRLYNDKRYKCSVCTHCDASFTGLWERTKGNTTTLYRDAETLNWLFFSEAVAEKRYVVKCKSQKDDKLEGYMAFDIIGSNQNIKIMQLIDALIQNSRKDIVISLLQSSKKLAKKLGIAALIIWSLDEDMNEIVKKKLKIRRRGKYPYFYKFKETGAHNTEQDFANKYIPSYLDPDRGVL